MIKNVFSKNGQLLPEDQATISLENIEFTYGFGVYESLKIRKGVTYFLDLHIDRLLHSAKTIELIHRFTFSFIRKSILELNSHLKQNDNQISANLKVLLIGGPEPQLYVLPLNPLFPDRNLFKKGATTGTVEYERWKPQAKTLNMLPSYFFYTQGKAKGWYDTLLVNRRGEITEGTRTNFFAIKESIIYNPPPEDVLQGVTYLTVTKVAKENGFEVIHQPLPLELISSFDSTFFTSTSSKILPIKQIDHVTFAGISPELKRLMKLYDEFLGNYGKNVA